MPVAAYFQTFNAAHKKSKTTGSTKEDVCYTFISGNSFPIYLRLEFVSKKRVCFLSPFFCGLHNERKREQLNKKKQYFLQLFGLLFVEG